MTEARVLYEREGDVGRVTLNQPDILNAINTDMVEELLAALDQASKEMRCVLLTGAGRGFCAGANLANVGRAAEHHGSTSLGASIESHFNPPDAHTSRIAGAPGDRGARARSRHRMFHCSGGRHHHRQ